MQNYGKQIKWSTINAPKPTGGICEDYSYEGRASEDDHENEAGDHAATIQHDKMADLSWSTKLTSDAKVPVLTNTAGCKVSINTILTGGALFSQITETWGIKAARRLQCSAQHFPDLPNGGSAIEATLADLDEITSQPICFPEEEIAWGMNGIGSALGIVQTFSITQSVRLTPYSEGGKIVTVIASLFQMRFNLQVIALPTAALPEPGMTLALNNAPARFKTGNFISTAAERARMADGVLYDISSRWTPALAA